MLNWLKHQICPEDGSEGTLLVDIETETEPRTDEDGNALYYCNEGPHVFSADEIAESVAESAQSGGWWKVFGL